MGGQGSGKSSFFRLLAGRDDWFSDDLKRLDDENVYRKMQGHWIIEMSEMIAAANAKSIEEIKAFLSRQKETYKVPYETHPADRLRQCVFCGSSNTMDFLPLDRTGNRRFVPVLVHPERAEIHVLEDEAASRAYLAQVWAQAMEVYRSGSFRLCFSREMEDYLRRHQRDFMPEDTKAGLIADYLDRCKERIVCSRQLFRDAPGRSLRSALVGHRLAAAGAAHPQKCGQIESAAHSGQGTQDPGGGAGGVSLQRNVQAAARLGKGVPMGKRSAGE